jgi:hypothetical protein
MISGWAICLKLSPNLRKKAKVKFVGLLFIELFLSKIRKGVEITSTTEPEFDKLVQELSRTISGNSINDILTSRMTHTED